MIWTFSETDFSQKSPFERPILDKNSSLKTKCVGYYFTNFLSFY